MVYGLLVWAFAAVMGRPEFSPEYWYLAFFSDGFKICIGEKRERRVMEEGGNGVGEGEEGERRWWY